MKQKLLLVYLLTYTYHLHLHIHTTAHMCAHIHMCTCMHTPSDVHTFESLLSELPESRWLLSCNPHAPVKLMVLGSAVSRHLPQPQGVSVVLLGPVPGSGGRGPAAQQSHYSQVGGCENSWATLKRLSTSSSLITVMPASLALK